MNFEFSLFLVILYWFLNKIIICGKWLALLLWYDQHDMREVSRPNTWPLNQEAPALRPLRRLSFRCRMLFLRGATELTLSPSLSLHSNVTFSVKLTWSSYLKLTGLSHLIYSLPIPLPETDRWCYYYGQ